MYVDRDQMVRSATQAVKQAIESAISAIWHQLLTMNVQSPHRPQERPGEMVSHGLASYGATSLYA